MRTVESIITDLYGSDPEMAAAVGVGRTAVSNWKAWGYFPVRLIPRIVADAAAKGVSLNIADIPIMQNTREVVA